MSSIASGMPASTKSKKYPGLDISSQHTARFGVRFSRKLVILAGRSIYEVSVDCKDKEFLNRPEVTAFFESLTIAD